MGTLFWAEQWGRWPARSDDLELVDRPIRVLGIDLGTTNSVVTDIIWDPTSGDEPSVETLDVPQLLHDGNEMSSERVPSVVTLHDGVELVGEGAKRLQAAMKRHGLSANRSIWWEQKSLIGTRRIHRSAPENYRSPAEVSARVLRFLLEAARDHNPDMEIDHVVVTIPASFQLTQRADTIAAAREAGLELDGENLLDEPIAAFIDYASLTDLKDLPASPETRVMVVDFGGGTCDVALLSIGRTESGTTVARRNVSRFHRIGGSDIDMAIANSVLLPRVLASHGLDAFTFDFNAKRDYILPALAAVAEKLKIKLSEEVVRLGIEEDEDLEVALPVAYDIPVPEGMPTLSLKPSLSLAEYREATEGFLTRIVTPPIGYEYYSVSSVFAPIDDAMRRAEWTAAHLDAILVVGGSSMESGFRRAIHKAFPEARLLTYRDSLAVQRAISRGAAINALYHVAFGRPPVQPTLGEGLSILTDKGLDVVVPAGTPLPYPEDGEPEVFDGLSIPASLETGALPLVLQFNSGGQTIYSQTSPIMAPITRGDRLELSVAIDADQVFTLRLDVRSPGNEQSLDIELANPLAITQNPNEDRDRIMELEELVEQGEGDGRQHIREMVELHKGLGEHERARHLLEGLLRRATAKKETRSLLFELALLCGVMGDTESQIAYYKRDLQMSEHPAAAFNLALALNSSGRSDEALKYSEMSEKGRDDAAAIVLTGSILERLKRTDEADEKYRTALEEAGEHLSGLPEFELNWLRYAAKRLRRDDVVGRIDEALKTLRERPAPTRQQGYAGGGYLPEKDG
jgi:molecular chaperone DnaK